MKKYYLLFVFLSSGFIFSCSSPIEKEGEALEVNSEINELSTNEVLDSHVVIQEDSLLHSEPFSDEVKSVPIRPLKEVEVMNKNEEVKTVHLRAGSYSAEELMIWALNSQKNALASVRPQLKVIDLDRYQLMLEVEQDNEQVFWYLVSYVGGERIDYILVAAQSSTENTSFEWEENSRVNVDRKMYNAHSRKHFTVHERYEIDNEGKFHKIAR